MKKVKYILFALLSAVSFSACTPEVDDYFDESSSQRIQTAMTETQQVLESAPNGWLMYYYGNTDYGGYNVYCKFANSQVTVQSEIFDNQSATTGYKIEQSSGVILSFDEYNYIFHFFSDPNVDVYQDSISSYYSYLLGESVLGTTGKAFEGDLEFMVLSASADSVVLMGKKHESKVVMYPAASGFNWSDYLSQVREADGSIFQAINYELALSGSRVLNVTQSSYHRMMTAVDENGNSHEMPYIVVPGGLKFYDPETYDDKTLEGFNVDEGATFTSDNGNGVTLTKIARPLVDQLIDGTWQVNYSNMSDLGKEYWDATYARETNRGFRGRYLYFGTYSFSSTYGTNFGLHVASRRSSNGSTYWGTIGLTATKVADDEITLSYNSDGNVLNGNYFYSTLRYYYLVYVFAGMPGNEPESRTFKLTTDNIYNPSYITLTDENDPSNVITVDQNYNSSPYTH